MDYSLLIGVVRRHFEVLGRDPTNPSDIQRPASMRQFQSANGEYKVSDALLKDEDGGMHAEIVEAPGTYYIGIIDILQEWNIWKKIERYYKIYFVGCDRNGLSAISPPLYQKRFMKRVIDEKFEGLESRLSLSSVSSSAALLSNILRNQSLFDEEEGLVVSEDNSEISKKNELGNNTEEPKDIEAGNSTATARAGGGGDTISQLQNEDSESSSAMKEPTNQSTNKNRKPSSITNDASRLQRDSNTNQDGFHNTLWSNEGGGVEEMFMPLKKKKFNEN